MKGEGGGMKGLKGPQLYFLYTSFLGLQLFHDIRICFRIHYQGLLLSAFFIMPTTTPPQCTNYYYYYYYRPTFPPVPVPSHDR